MTYTFGNTRPARHFIRVCRSGSVSLGFGASVVTLQPGDFYQMLEAMQRAAEELRLDAGSEGDGGTNRPSHR